MNMLRLITNRIQLSRKRRKLREVQHWIWQVQDQIESGQAALSKAKLRESQLEAEIFGLETPDEIVRRVSHA